MRRRKAVRGWVLSQGQILNTFSTVGNTVVEGLSAGIVLQGSDIDYSPMVGELKSDFCVRRILVWGVAQVNTAALNLSQKLEFDCALVKGDPQNLATPAALSPLSTETWLENTSRFLRYERYELSQWVGTAPGQPTQVIEGVDNAFVFRWDIDRLNMNVPENELIYLLLGQPTGGGGSGWANTDWIDGDNVSLAWHARVLLQKRRD